MPAMSTKSTVAGSALRAEDLGQLGQPGVGDTDHAHIGLDDVANG